MDFTAEISRNMSENEEDLNEDRMAKVEALKAERRKLKGAITTAKRVSGYGCWRQQRG